MDRPNVERPDSERVACDTLDIAAVPTWFSTRDRRGAFTSRYSVIAHFRLAGVMDDNDFTETERSVSSESRPYGVPYTT